MELDVKHARTLTDMCSFLAYMVEVYGQDIYLKRQRLANLIADLYAGEAKIKRIYQRIVLYDNLSERIYKLLEKDTSERKAMVNSIACQFIDRNFFQAEFGKQVVSVFAKGINLFPSSSFEDIDLSQSPCTLLPETESVDEEWILFPPDANELSTEVDSDEDVWVDKRGVAFSEDKRRLIKANERLKKYTIPKGTMVICDDAFGWCVSMISLTIPKGVTKIGSGVFFMCESLTSLVFPNSVRTMGQLAFFNCKSLSSIVLPSDLTVIDDQTFDGCESLTSIVFPANLKTISQNAFRGCTSLESIALPDSLISIGESSFGCCESLTSFVFAPNL